MSSSSASRGTPGTSYGMGAVALHWSARSGAVDTDHGGVRRNRAIFHPTEDIHGYLAYTLFALAGLHVLAALWHQYVRRDGVLQRMWPWGRGS